MVFGYRTPNNVFDPTRFYHPPRPSYRPMTDDWRRWIGENLLLGSSRDSIAATLVKHGIDPAIAQAEIELAQRSPYLQAGANFVQILRKIESHLDNYASLAALSPRSQQIDRRDRITPEEFRETYYSRNQPVILTGMMDDWPALTQWTPEGIRDRFGDLTIEVQTNRHSNRRYELEVDRHRTTMTLREYADLVLAGGETNDYYMVANNGNLDRPELRPLLDDICWFEGIHDPTCEKGKVFFWFGPAGTVTPLHHDPSNLFMAQIYGRKLWRMIPPYFTHKIYNYVGVFSEVDLEQPDLERYPLFREIPIIETVLHPGEAIFVPVGWWHHVRGLDVTLSLSFTNLTFPNHYEWNYPHVQR